MRLLILGGDGMLGHQLFRHMRGGHQVKVTLRQDLASYAAFRLFDRDNAYHGLDARDTEAMMRVLDEFRPEVVVNAVGIVKQRRDANDAIASIEINSLLPHRLAVLCRGAGARLIHFSTDCVFSGRNGNYRESSVPDAEDLYGRSKLLGEIDGDSCMTLRTSFIGPELSRKTGLLEWFLAQRGSIKGYRKAIFSGFTAIEMSRIIERVATGFPDASGIYHVSSAPISKYDLLCKIRDSLGRKIEIEPDDAFQCDRALDSSRFRKEFGYTPPGWGEMIDELAQHLKEART
jgi:dTDP-4-dehydrorhamnose reductase